MHSSGCRAAHADPNRRRRGARSWMEFEELSGVFEKEREHLDTFEYLPFHYEEIARIIFKCADPDIPDAERVRTMLEDIRNVRMNKIRRGMQTVAKIVAEEDER